MRASWLKHSCLLASCVSLLFLIQGKTRVNKGCIDLVLVLSQYERDMVVWSTRWHFLVLRAHPVFQLIIIQCEVVNIKGCFAASEKCQTLAFIDTQLQEKRKKYPLNVFTMTAVQVSRLIDFYFLPWLCWYFSVCPAVPSLPTVSQSVSVSVPLLSLLLCCQLFVLRLFLVGFLVCCYVFVFNSCLYASSVPWLPPPALYPRSNPRVHTQFCFKSLSELYVFSIGFYFVLPCDFVYLDYWSANKGFC